jgi:hypothetical protein
VLVFALEDKTRARRLKDFALKIEVRIARWGPARDLGATSLRLTTRHEWSILPYYYPASQDWEGLPSRSSRAEVRLRPRGLRRDSLARCRERRLERVKGIEPSPKAWEAFVLPLNYTREPRTPPNLSLARNLGFGSQFIAYNTHSAKEAPGLRVDDLAIARGNESAAAYAVGGR